MRLIDELNSSWVFEGMIEGSGLIGVNLGLEGHVLLLVLEV